MLEEMLVDGYFGKATAFLASSASGSSDVITEDIIRMNQVVKNIGDWKDKLASVQAEYENHPGIINQMHGAHKDLLYRK